MACFICVCINTTHSLADSVVFAEASAFSIMMSVVVNGTVVCLFCCHLTLEIFKSYFMFQFFLFFFLHYIRATPVWTQTINPSVAVFFRFKLVHSEFLKWIISETLLCLSSLLCLKNKFIKKIKSPPHSTDYVMARGAVWLKTKNAELC